MRLFASTQGAKIHFAFTKMQRRLRFLLVSAVLLGQEGTAFAPPPLWKERQALVSKCSAEIDTYTPPDDPPQQRRGRLRPLRRQEQLSSRAQERQEQAQDILKRQEIAQKDPNLLVDTRFAQLVSPPTLRACQEMGVDRLTVVQERTFALARNGTSLVVRARTGTGKTLAFLVPLVERLRTMHPAQFQPQRQIGALIVAPTRELAMQIADTAKDLVTYEPTLSVRAVYGGTSIQKDVRSLEERMPSILVATPGRLRDLIQEERIRGRKFCDILKDTSIIVLDEADLLVTGGFAKDVLNILSHLPRKRQTMMFSATIPKRLQAILPEVCMTSELTHIDCFEEENDSSKLRVSETYLTLDSFENYVTLLLALIRELLSSNTTGRGRDNKIMVFLPAIRMVRFFADVIRECMKDVSVWQIHSQLSQSARRRVADSFRRTSSGVLLTSDLSARGMDYPDVDTVVQYGMPNRRDLYLHRIGRTGRAGRTGQAILVLMPFENLSALGKTKHRIDESRTGSFIYDSTKSVDMGFVRTKISEKTPPLYGCAEGFVLAFLAYYSVNRPPKSVPGSSILSAGETLARSLGLDALPELPESLMDDLRT